MPACRTNPVEYALKLLVASRVPTRANSRSDLPAHLDSVRLSRGPPTCWPPGMYRDAAATATPRSTSRARSSICRGSSLPSAMVTTVTGESAPSKPALIAFAGPGP